MQKIYGIQWLRGIAAVMVVVFHAAGRWGYSFRIGEAGVDVFFIISGFIMWSIAASQNSMLNFLYDRILRVAPIYWLATGAMALGGLIGLFPRVIVSVSYVAKSLFFIPYLGYGYHAWPLLVQGWTLNYEMFFYVIFSFLIKFPISIRLRLLVGILTILVVAGSLINSGNMILRFYTDPIILEFAVGALLAKYFTYRSFSRSSICTAVLLALAIITAHVFYDVQIKRLLQLGIPSALAVCIFIYIEKSGIPFRSRLLNFLGDASYSIYLFHTFAISVVARLFPHPMEGVSPAVAAIIGVGFGCVAYTFLEKPLANKVRRLKKVPQSV